MVAFHYIACDRDQLFLMPPSVRDWLPPEHLVWLVLDLVGQLDTSGLHARHPNEGAGRPAYDPDMLLVLLIYAYAHGYRSSRVIERLCEVDVAFRVITGNTRPDHSTIARWHGAHQDAFDGLFAQVLVVCAAAGLGRLGQVAIDGSKVAGNASRTANRGWEALRREAETISRQARQTDAAEDRLFGAARGDELPEELTDPRSRAARLRRCVEQVEQAQRQADRGARDGGGGGDCDRDGGGGGGGDAQAGERCWPGTPGSRAARRDAAAETGRLLRGRAPAGVDEVGEATAQLRAAQVRRQARRAKERAAAERTGGGKLPGSVPDLDTPVREAQRQLRRARRRAARRTARQTRQAAADAAAAEQRRGARVKTPQAARWANTTDPDTRTMKGPHGWVQGYNCQFAVTDDQLILAATATQDPTDTAWLAPMMTAARSAARVAGLGEIEVITADAGYFSDNNLTATGPPRLIPDRKDRIRRAELAASGYATGDPPPEATPAEQMRHRLATDTGAATYARRGVTVEPVIGQLKNRGMTRFRRRGLPAVNAELTLNATVHNVLKLLTHPRAHTATG